jgi:hypothetical protein
MGNIFSNKQIQKSTSKSTEQQWKIAIKKQLQNNLYMYLRYEIVDEMTYHSGRTEISKRKLLCLLKTMLAELQLSFFITITPTNKPSNYFIHVSIIYYIKKDDQNDEQNEEDNDEQNEETVTNNSSIYRNPSFSFPRQNNI